jgi:uncharacterized damage-inducible protein DinB
VLGAAGRGPTPAAAGTPLGYLATLVATMPSWIVWMVKQDGLDLHPPNAPAYKQPELRTRRELLEALESGVAKAREALAGTNDEHLMTPWKFMAAGKVLSEQPRYVMIQDAVFQHLAHHRGQLTVYLRLNGAPVPAIYGPSADENVTTS